MQMGVSENAGYLCWGLLSYYLGSYVRVPNPQRSGNHPGSALSLAKPTCTKLCSLKADFRNGSQGNPLYNSLHELFTYGIYFPAYCFLLLVATYSIIAAEAYLNYSGHSTKAQQPFWKSRLLILINPCKALVKSRDISLTKPYAGYSGPISPKPSTDPWPP